MANPLERTHVTWHEWKTAIFNRRAATIQLITAVLTFIGSAVGFGELDDILDSPDATITTPAEPFVPKTFRLTGTHEDIDEDDILWAVSRRYDDGKFYPQDKQCTDFNDGTFDCGDYYLGNQEGGDANKGFDLIIVRPGIETVKVFLLFQRGDITDGLTELPEDAEILARVQKTRI